MGQFLFLSTETKQRREHKLGVKEIYVGILDLLLTSCSTLRLFHDSDPQCLLQ